MKIDTFLIIIIFGVNTYELPLVTLLSNENAAFCHIYYFNFSRRWEVGGRIQHGKHYTVFRILYLFNLSTYI
jgi:hypothetical protein